ncbi:hypothetical protein ACU6VJ_21375 (plasmid) [Sphaerotilus sulfidivorans]
MKPSWLGTAVRAARSDLLPPESSYIEQRSCQHIPELDFHDMPACAGKTVIRTPGRACDGGSRMRFGGACGTITVPHLPDFTVIGLDAEQVITLIF